VIPVSSVFVFDFLIKRKIKRR